MNKKRKNWIIRHKWWCIACVVALVMVYAFVGTASKVVKKDFVTMDVMRGNLSQTVTATGEIRPLNTVSVGSQVSGTIENIYVDYNSRVTKGQLLLEIEPGL